MTIPFVIDNQQHNMADVLNDLLHHHRGHSLDVAPRLLPSEAGNSYFSKTNIPVPSSFPTTIGTLVLSLVRRQK